MTTETYATMPSEDAERLREAQRFVKNLAREHRGTLAAMYMLDAAASMNDALRLTKEE